MMNEGRAHVLIDGQFGSTGKGLLAAYLARHWEFDICTTNASANAGHTTVFEDGGQIVCYHLPTAGVMQPSSRIYLNAGSIIDPVLLTQEIAATGVSPARVVVHPNAAVIRPEDKATEAAAGSPATAIGSTQKGVGAALAHKLSRAPGGVVGSEGTLRGQAWLEQNWPAGVKIDRIDLNPALLAGARVLVEVPQGFGLGINSTYFYPYCTSREVTVAQGLADAGIHPSFLGEVVMSLRTYPIRVGNIYDGTGTQIGYSGPCYGDQQELDWRDVGVAPELTTVTKRPRRVFSWSLVQTAHAFQVNRPTIVFLNFCNYLRYPYELQYRVHDITQCAGPRKIKMLFGFGPKVSDIVDDYPLALERVEAQSHVAVAAK